MRLIIQDNVVVKYEEDKHTNNVIIPYGVTKIGKLAFYGCNNLTSITIPNSVTSIDENAFYWCKNLVSVTIPNNVTSIGNNAFWGCENLKEVHINSIEAWLKIQFEKYSSNPLSNGASLFVNGKENLIIPNGTEMISNYVFGGCENLTAVTIPDSVKVIGTGAFQSCNNLKKVYVSSIESWLKIKFRGKHSNPLNNGALLIVNGLIENNIIILDGIKSIGNYAFNGYRNLTSVTIPSSVKSIGTSAFNGCENLTSITIPNSVTSIGKTAFAYCKPFASITIPDSVTRIGEDVFYYCFNLRYIVAPSICIDQFDSEAKIAAIRGFIQNEYSNVEVIESYDKYLKANKDRILKKAILDEELMIVEYYLDHYKTTDRKLIEYIELAQENKVFNSLAILMNWKQSYIKDIDKLLKL